MIKNIVIFVGGVVAGATASYIYVKKKYEKLANDEIDSVKEYTKKQIESYKNDAAKASKMLELITTPNTKEKEEVEKKMKDNDKVDYSSYSKPSPKEVEVIDEEMEDEEEHLEGREMNKGNLDKVPFIISEDEFGLLPVNDARTLMYYTYDDVLTTEEEEIITDIEEHLGDTLEESGFLDDPNMRSYYIRNMPLNCDYEVIKVESSFEESRVLT